MDSMQFDKEHGPNEILFWQPFSEESINEIVWDPTQQAKTITTKAKASKKPKVAKDVTIVLDSPTQIFKDSEVIILPRQFLETVLCWKRPSEFFSDIPGSSLSGKVVMYSGTDDDLYEHNKHLQSSSYYSHIINSFELLKLYKEFEADDFQPFGFKDWKPTNYIYAMHKVEKGKPHAVAINSYGKYIVRLYHCGKWRQIVVDDRIPINIKQEILLPCIRTEDRLELWPLLISKAILKINLHRILDDDHFYFDQQATHQCRMYDGQICKCKDVIPVREYYLYNESDISRLNATYLLTGWFPDEIEFSNKRSERVWETFNNIFEIFDYPPVTQTERRELTKQKVVKVINTPKIIYEEPTPTRDPNPLITLDLFLRHDAKLNRNIYMEVMCTLIRSIPLEETSEQPAPLPLWKTYRWMYWAMKKGIWRPADEKINWSLLCAVTTSRIDSFVHLFEREWAQKFYNKEERLKSSADLKKSKSKKNLGTSAKLSKELKIPEKTKKDPTMWLDFNQTIHMLECLKIYLKDHKFTKNIFISNENEPSQVGKPKLTAEKGSKATATTKAKAGLGSINEDPASTESRIYADGNTSLYLFVDQDDPHDAVLDLTIMKHDRNVLDTKVKIEYYQWNCQKQQQLTTIATTCATGQKVRLPAGCTVFRITIRSSSFCFHIKTNSPKMKIVSYEDIFDLMNADGNRFDSYLEQILYNVKVYSTSIGEPTFLENMFEFYNSLMEFCLTPYKYVAQIRRYVQERMKNNFVIYLKSLNDVEGIRLLRRFLIQTDWPRTLASCIFRKDFLKKVKQYNSLRNKVCDCSGEPPLYTETEEDMIRNSAAIVIQSVMKMYYVKQLLRYHDKNEPNRARCLQFQKEISELFGKYFVTGSEDFKNFLRYQLTYSTFDQFPQAHLLIPFTKSSNIGEIYEFYTDFHYSVRKLSITHVCEKASAHKWYPLKMGCLFCHSATFRRYMLRVRSNVPNNKTIYFVKIINNDDLKEVIATEIPNIWMLHQNKAGYKVFVYMFASSDIENESWTLEIIFPRNIAYAHFCDVCNDTMCPCDREETRTDAFPLLCKPTDLSDFEIFNEDGETTSKQRIVCKYRLKVFETMFVNVFVSSSYELFEFEIKLIQDQTRQMVANEIDFGRVAIVGSFLRLALGNHSYHKSTDFWLTITCIRRIRPTMERSTAFHTSEQTLKSGKSTSDHIQSMRQSTTVPENLCWNVKIAYDKGSNIEIERVDLSA